MAAAVKILTSPGAYIQGPGALSVLAERCLALNCRGAYLILGGTARRQHGAALAASFGRVGMACRLAEFGGECCDREIEAHLAALDGCGGGRRRRQSTGHGQGGGPPGGSPGGDRAYHRFY